MGKAYDLFVQASKNIPTGFNELLKLVTYNPVDSECINYLGVCYDQGYCVPINYATAFTYFQGAAALKHPLALTNLGLYYQYGKGVPIDLSLAVYWYVESAKLNSNDSNASPRAIKQLTALAAVETSNPKVINGLANCYLGGYSLPKDEKKAIELYTLLANAGDDEAEANLGLCYQYGLGVVQDHNIASRRYLAAAEKNTKNPRGSLLAIQKLKELAEAQSPAVSALHNLAFCYHQGYSIKIDKKVAEQLFLAAAKKGHAPAQYNVAVTYEENAQDLALAAYWYLQAAKQQSKTAVTKLKEQASKKNPHPAILNALGECYREGYGEEKNPHSAIMLFQQSAKLGNVIAMINLGDVYYVGTGIEKDATMAGYWYREAIKQKAHPERSTYALKQLETLALQCPDNASILTRLAKCYEQSVDKSHKNAARLHLQAILVTQRCLDENGVKAADLPTTLLNIEKQFFLLFCDDIIVLKDERVKLSPHNDNEKLKKISAIIKVLQTLHNYQDDIKQELKTKQLLNLLTQNDLPEAEHLRLYFHFEEKMQTYFERLFLHLKNLAKTIDSIKWTYNFFGEPAGIKAAKAILTQLKCDSPNIIATTYTQLITSLQASVHRKNPEREHFYLTTLTELMNIKFDINFTPSSDLTTTLLEYPQACKIS